MKGWEGGSKGEREGGRKEGKEAGVVRMRRSKGGRAALGETTRGRRWQKELLGCEGRRRDMRE